MKNVILSRSVLLLTAMGSVGLSGCKDENKFVPPPPPKVTVAQPLQQEVVIYSEFTGRTEAVALVEVRARVRGFLKSIEFEEGARIEAGALLYTLEPEEYEASLQAAQAQKAGAEAELQETQTNFEHIERLHEQGNAASMEFVEAQAEYEGAKASLLAAEAAVAQAELDLAYTRIAAPIGGRVNRSAVDTGNLVGQGEPTLLTTIVSWEPIHVYFTISEREVLDFRRRRIGAKEEPADIEARLTLADGTAYPLPGRIDYADNRVDPQTGTIRVRAVFENPDRLLVPGIFARVRIPRKKSQATLVPEVALQRDLGGYFVLTVNDKGVVARRDVTVGANVGEYKVIASGLDGGERIVIRGLQRARPGVHVDAESTVLPSVEQPGHSASPDATTTQSSSENQ